MVPLLMFVFDVFMCQASQQQHTMSADGTAEACYFLLTYQHSNSSSSEYTPDCLSDTNTVPRACQCFLLLLLLSVRLLKKLISFALCVVFFPPTRASGT